MKNERWRGGDISVGHSSTVGNAANVKNVKIFQRSFKLTFFELVKYLY